MKLKYINHLYLFIIINSQMQYIDAGISALIIDNTPKRNGCQWI